MYMMHWTYKCYFSPQVHLIFRHQNFKKCSEPGVFCTFSLENALRATAACNFWTSELQKVLRTGRVLYIVTCTCASRHSGVQFFDIGTLKSAPGPSVLAFSCQNALHHSGVQFLISPLTTHLGTRRFSRPTLYNFTRKCTARHSDGTLSLANVLRAVFCVSNCRRLSWRPRRRRCGPNLVSQASCFCNGIKMHSNDIRS